MLLPYSYFDPIFEPLKSKKVHFLPNTHGNVGDDLINEATYQLFSHYQIPLLDFESSDTVIFAGGGNFGMKYYYMEHRSSYYQKIRQSPTKKEVIIFPQSIYRNKSDSGEEVIPHDLISKFYVRDRKSLSIMPYATLAPDLALGYNHVGQISAPTKGVGIFLRTDVEARFYNNYINDGDPVKMAPKLPDYLALAMQYEHIYTDRLHFAIGALLLGRKATILPNIYYKNRMLWETWLKDVGCEWAEKPPTPKRYWISVPPIVSFYYYKIRYKLS